MNRNKKSKVELEIFVAVFGLHPEDGTWGVTHKSMILPTIVIMMLLMMMLMLLMMLLASPMHNSWLPPPDAVECEDGQLHCGD